MATILFIGPAASSAACDISTYDSIEPSALSDVVDNPYAHFEWASDVEPGDGYHWIWNYIVNLDTRSLSARWEKAGIEISIVNPLPPLQVFCNRYPVRAYEKVPDMDAPIVYGTSERIQRAGIFTQSVSEELDNKKIVNEIETAIMGFEGEVQKISATVSFTPIDEGYYVYVDAPDDIYVGISGIEGNWSNSIIDQLLYSDKDMDDKSVWETMSAFSSGTAAFKEYEMLQSDVKTLFLKGGLQEVFVPTPIHSEWISANISLFDRNREFLAYARASLPSVSD